MDKSFNDQELSDIMKEIEALEEEFSVDEDTTKIEATSLMEELADLDVTQSVRETNTTENVLAFEKRVEPQAIKSGAQSSMMFKVQGEMNLELQFEIGGKLISLDVSEKGLTIQMDGGMTFTVPVADAQTIKKAV